MNCHLIFVTILREFFQEMTEEQDYISHILVQFKVIFYSPLKMTKYTDKPGNPVKKFVLNSWKAISFYKGASKHERWKNSIQFRNYIVPSYTTVIYE